MDFFNLTADGDGHKISWKKITGERFYVFFFFPPGGSHSSVFFWLQEVHSQLCSQKAQFQRLMERLKMKHSDTLAPSEIEGQLQEVTQSLQQLEQKVASET